MVLRTPGDRYSVFVSFLLCIVVDCSLWQATENSTQTSEGVKRMRCFADCTHLGLARPQLFVGPQKIVTVSPSPSISFSVLFWLHSQTGCPCQVAKWLPLTSTHRSLSKSLIGLIGLSLGRAPHLWVESTCHPRAESGEEREGICGGGSSESWMDVGGRKQMSPVALLSPLPTAGTGLRAGMARR